MPNAEADIVGIGLATLDQIGVGPRSWEAAVELDTFSVQGGGPTGTALAAASAFGARTKYFSRLGDDEFGRLIQSRLRSFGVDTSQTLAEPGRLSPITFVMIEEHGGRRYTRYTRGDTTPLVAADIPRDLVESARILYLDAEMMDAQIAAAERARAAGVRVVLGVRRMSPGVGELIGLADAVIASERVASELTRSADIDRAIRDLRQMGPEIAVITLGSDGAVASDGASLVRQAALPVHVVDVTGAGSVFRGAFTYALLRDWPLARALPFASAAAGLNCQCLGGQQGIPTLEATERASAVAA
jgi:sugar/nucleoside kinase (ribokinase family)